MKTLLLALALMAAFAMARAPAAAPGGPVAPAACEASVATRSTVAMRQDGTGVLIESGGAASGSAGRLTLRALSASASGAIVIGMAPLWDAGAVLTGDPAAGKPARPAAQDRRIYTLLRNADGSSASVPFEWGQIGSVARDWLDGDSLGESRVGFLRGERGREIGQPDGVFRRRAGILGAAGGSTPLLVGAPSASVQGPGYAAFHSRYTGRAEAIYLGADDGMLHAFDARDGVELFAYIPNALIASLAQLSEPDYRPRPHVDASAGQAEALLNGRWRSVLVAGMGMGARGVFALDVSDPAAFDAGARALWEFTEQDDPDIGRIGAAPLIAKLKVGVRESMPQFRYFALVSSAPGALFLLALDKPSTERWQRDVNYYKLEAPAAVPGQPNRLGQPGLVSGPDGSVRYAYAGDLQGTLWRFDLSGKPPFASGALFAARDDSGRRQPITKAPRVVFAPGGGYLVLFGTGVFEDGDVQPAEFAVQSFYAVKDSATSALEKVNGRRELARRTLSGDAIHTVAGDEFDYTGTRSKKGWYFDFQHAAADGERLAASPVLAGGTVIVSTVVGAGDPCAAAATRTYVLDTLTGFTFDSRGAAVSGNSTGKLKKGAVTTVLQLGAIMGSSMPTGAARATRKLGIVHLQADGAAPEVQQVDVNTPAGRISWREVANWQELHEAAKK